jgi:DNA-binding NarL/FixJ family response regulator
MRDEYLIVDDNASFLEASRTLLERQGVAVIGTATSAAEGLQRAAELNPDVILIDIDLGKESGFDLAQQLADHHPHIILISTHREEDFADLIAESPARGFLAKSDLSKQAIHHIIHPPHPTTNPSGTPGTRSQPALDGDPHPSPKSATW